MATGWVVAWWWRVPISGVGPTCGREGLALSNWAKDKWGSEEAVQTANINMAGGKGEGGEEEMKERALREEMQGTSDEKSSTEAIFCDNSASRRGRIICDAKYPHQVLHVDGRAAALGGQGESAYLGKRLARCLNMIAFRSRGASAPDANSDFENMMSDCIQEGKLVVMDCAENETCKTLCILPTASTDMRSVDILMYPSCVSLESCGFCQKRVVLTERQISFNHQEEKLNRIYGDHCTRTHSASFDDKELYSKNHEVVHRERVSST
eukprot:749586-Hanusia_phi.AAC.5